VTHIYNGQRSSSRRRGHRLPEYTMTELSDWLYSQVLFHTLYVEWKQSGYKKRLRPSVDRINNYIHYCMPNIQLMTWDENRIKAYTDHKNGKLNYDLIPVVRYSKKGIFIDKFHSISQAGRDTGIDISTISKAIRGVRKYGGGFKWRYAHEG